jgi:hypothetical protein
MTGDAVTAPPVRVVHATHGEVTTDLPAVRPLFELSFIYLDHTAAVDNCRLRRLLPASLVALADPEAEAEPREPAIPAGPGSASAKRWHSTQQASSAVEDKRAILGTRELYPVRESSGYAFAAADGR